MGAGDGKGSGEGTQNRNSQRLSADDNIASKRMFFH